jgi:NAD(P)-dependent dehydrogenase (short-subunit alcohol dehydrogenase family)
MKNLEGKSALITGGLTGQGFAIAQALAAEGANVAVGSFVGADARLGDAAAYPEKQEIRKVRDALEAPSAFSSTQPVPRRNNRYAGIQTSCGTRSSIPTSRAPSA